MEVPFESVRKGPGSVYLENKRFDPGRFDSNELIEKMVCKQPADYLWVPRRFKTQAVEADSPYPPELKRRRK